MHSVAARIALLAYLVGGMAVPVMHRHAASTSRDEVALHAHGGCVHDEHAHPHSAARDVDAEESATATVADASPDHAGTCSDNCVVCLFAGSPQSGSVDDRSAFSADPAIRVTWGDVGPGFEASDYQYNRLRGPPVSMILG